ncbi:MAG: cation transporter, partial [Clostridia bacterium]|nr:cation transporter [Clostridia bacterium]
MTRLLLRLFVRDYKNVNNKRVRGAYGTLSSIVGIVVNFLLSLAKFLVGMLFGSIAISADAINNLSDAGSSLLSLISFKISSKPADREHPFGHARIEYVASMIVSFLIIHIGISLLIDSIKKIIEPQVTKFSMLSVIVLAVSILTKLWLYLFNNKMGKAINSQVLRATALDSLSDTISTSAVLISVLCLHFFDIDIDAYVGILVSGFILFSGGKILNDTKNSILGEAPSHETVEAIKALVSEYPEAIGIHDMLIHSYGANNTIASFHVEVDGSKDIFKSHDTIDNIERRIREELGIECTIHMDPLITDDERINALHGMTMGLVSEIDDHMRIHDFRVVEGDTHTNLIFDI